MAQKNWKNGLTIFIIIVIIAIIASAVAAISSLKETIHEIPPTYRKEKTAPYEGVFAQIPFRHRRQKKITDDYIAMIHIEGVIQERGDTYNQEWLLNTLEDLQEDTYNKAIILFLDTPGGTVYESDEAYLALMEYKKSGKPIYAYMAHIAASGGYYIACSADKIFANRNTVTGSIGVINGTSFDATELFKKIGLKPSTFSAGRNKNMRGIDTPITEEQRKIIQSELDEAYDQFTSIVAESRKMKIEKVRQLADGRTYTARQAKSNGLIDEIGTLDDTIDALNEFLENDCDTIDYEYIYERNMFDYFRFSKTKSESNIEKLAAQIFDITNKYAPNIRYPAYLCLE